MGRIEYWNDPAARKPNSLVPACGVLAVDDLGRVLLQRRRDTGQWAIPMGKQELGETPGRRTIADATSRFGDDGHNGVLGVALAHWMARDDSKVEPEVCRAANTAMDAIDAMLADLRALRARLVSEIRKSGDVSAAHIDDLLERLRSDQRWSPGHLAAPYLPGNTAAQTVKRSASIRRHLPSDPGDCRPGTCRGRRSFHVTV